MRQKQTLLAPAACLLFAALIAAHANVAPAQTTFAAAGVFEDGSILSGTLTIDTVTGVATALDLTIAGSHPDHFTLLNDFQVGDPGLGNYGIVVRDIHSGDVLDIEIPSPDGGTSLTGYSGGPLYSDANLWRGVAPLSAVSQQGVPLIDSLASGSLVPIPEPGTLILLLSALVTFGGMGLLRRLRAVKS